MPHNELHCVPHNPKPMLPRVLIAYLGPMTDGTPGWSRVRRVMLALSRAGAEVTVLGRTEGGSARAAGPAAQDVRQEIESTARGWRGKVWNTLRQAASADRLRPLIRLLTATPDPQVGTAVRVASRLLARPVRHKVDLVLSTGPPHSSHLAGALIASVLGTPHVVEFRDPWAHAPWGARVRNLWGERFARHLERMVLQRAHLIVTVTYRHAERLRLLYPLVPAERIVTVRNGFDPQPGEQCGPSHHTSAARTLPRDRYLLIHAGSLYRKRDPRCLIRALTILTQAERRQLCFVHVGRTSPLYRTVLEHAMTGDGCITLIDPLPPDEVRALYERADAFWILQPGTGLQVPSKLFEVIPYGRPILYIGAEGEGSDIVRCYQLGLAVDSRNPAAIANAVRCLLRRRDECVSRAGWRRAMVDFNGTKLADGYARLLLKLVAGRPPVASYDQRAC